MTQSGVTNQETKAGFPESGARVSRVSFEHHREATGIGEASPRLSWIVETTQNGWQQAAYEVELYGPEGQLNAQTGRVTSAESVLVTWPFPPLASREQAQVHVRVWGEDGEPTGWSQLYSVEAGLLEPADWTAQFITPDLNETGDKPQPSPLLRKEFEVRPGVSQARLYITALGLYEAELNGNRVGDHVLAPGWTSYQKRLRYQTFDVTDLLKPGRNCLGAVLGEGWFKGRLLFGGGRRNIYGDKLALLSQLEIIYSDGSTERIVTDESWRTATGPILESGIYDGETYDARLERDGWSKPGYDDREWNRVRQLDWDFTTLEAPLGPPVRRTEEVNPVSLTKSPSGKVILDFGQNLVGFLRLTVRGKAGQTITLRHAEVLQDGEIYTRPLRFAKATDHYILRGGGPETYEPHFTFHGFRYAEVEGWPGELKAEDIKAVVCHSDMERTGWFESSDPLLNRLHENVVWSMRGNFLDLPTDCPQRDERLGWTGDIQVFSPTASYLYDCAGFLSSWLADLAADQTESGIVPFVIPDVMDEAPIPTAAWGDAAVFVPWVLYQRFGDKGILETQFKSMRGWVDCLASIAGEKLLWDEGFQFGDWLDPAAPPDRPGEARTSPDVIATAYFARSAELVGQAARVLGKTEEAEHYLELANKVRQAFNKEYVTPGGRLLSDTTTAYSQALQFDLLPTPEQRAHAGERLVQLVRDSDYHISTGFVGTPLICDALSSMGEYEAAYLLITQRDNPSWLYPVTMGATTIWERWDSMLPDGTVNPGEMTSFNHYALGAVADWLHRVVGGLAPAAPGYSRLEIKPVPGGGLSRARTRHLTPYGVAECAWELKRDEIEVSLEIPANVTAEVTLPGSDAQPLEVGSGTYRWSYRYQNPVDSRPVLTLDSPVNDFVDNPAAYRVVIQVISSYLPNFTAWREKRLRRFGTKPMRQALTFLPDYEAILKDLQKALAE
ncbi:MAG TPA: family 78 glycoside hydrolase catalytic domain [Chloroflexia bacterium]|nr:family 78 glycoside hydrolase catalytic domain [Chloroflexia bacterium]